MIRLILLSIFICAFSGCAQSRVVDCPFEQVVTHLEARYGTTLRELKEQKIVQYIKDNPLEFSREEKREMFDEHMADPVSKSQADKHFKQFGIKEDQYFDYIMALTQMLEEKAATTLRTISYVKGESLELSLQMSFIANVNQKVKVQAVDSQRTRISIDQYSSVSIIFSTMRDSERKYLDGIQKEIKTGKITQHYRKKKPLMTLPDWFSKKTKNAQPHK